MELLAEIAIQVLGVLLEVFLQVILQPWIDILGSAWRPKEKTDPILAGAGIISMGTFSGLIFTHFIHYRVLPVFLPYSGLILNPLASGFAMHYWGKWRDGKDKDISYMATWWGGALFAFFFTLSRLVMLRFYAGR